VRYEDEDGAAFTKALACGSDTLFS
jgi:hypothetical protein